MLYILSGQDDFLIAQALGEIKSEMGDPSFLAMSTTTLDGKDVTPQQLGAVLQTAPFLSGERLVIIRGLLERFEPRGRSRHRQANNSATRQQDERRSFSDCFSDVPESTVVVLLEGMLSPRNTLFQELTAKARVKLLPLLRREELGEWIRKRVKEGGGGVSPQAVRLLIRLVGSNLWIMAGELEKLSLFASGRRIEEEDVRTLVSYAQQDSVFALVDAIVELKVNLAEQILERLLKEGAAPAYLLFMLCRQVRLIVRAKGLTSQKKTRAEMQSRLGLVSDFALRKTLEQARRYSLARLKRVYQQLLETDIAIKTGKYEGELALNILVAELCR